MCFEGLCKVEVVFSEDHVVLVGGPFGEFKAEFWFFELRAFFANNAFDNVQEIVWPGLFYG